MTLPAVERFANNAQTTLTAAMTDTIGTSASITAATLFPAKAQYRILIDSEIMIVTGGAGTTTWTVTRGADGTTAATHSNAAPVTHIVTKQAIERWIPEYNPHPRNQGLVAWTYDPLLASATGFTSVSQTIYFSKIYIPESCTLSKLWFSVQTLGASFTNTNAAIWDGSGDNGAAGTRIANTGSLNAIVNTTGVKQVTLIADTSLNVVGGPGVWVYAGIWQDATTPAKFANVNQDGNTRNLNLAAGAVRFGTWAGQATFPTALTLSNVAENNPCLWMGLS